MQLNVFQDSQNLLQMDELDKIQYANNVSDTEIALLRVDLEHLHKHLWLCGLKEICKTWKLSHSPQEKLLQGKNRSFALLAFWAKLMTK